MATVVDDGNIRIERLELGPWATNAYIVVCRRTGDSALVDAPAQANEILLRLEGTRPVRILITHRHGDHIGALAEVRTRLGVPVAIHAADAPVLRSPPDALLADGDVLHVGRVELRVLHTPGHTPGSLCFRTGNYLLSGDTIFPGGPGRTESPAALRQIIESITGKILPLPDNTEIYPGHGSPTTLKKEKDEFAIFSSRPHNPDLCGDVTWLSSG